MGNNIFIFGGVSWGLSRSIYVYNTMENTFTELEKFLIDARAGGSAVVLDEYSIAIIGGFNEGSQPMASVEVISIDYNDIYYQENVEPLNYARSEPAVVKLDSFVYVFGGEDNNDNCIPLINSDDRINLLETFELYQNFPNPFNPSTTIKFSNAKTMHIKLDIYSIDGLHVKTLINNSLEAGDHQFMWDGTDKHHIPVSSGLYFYKLYNGFKSVTKRMILLR